MSRIQEERTPVDRSNLNVIQQRLDGLFITPVSANDPQERHRLRSSITNLSLNTISVRSIERSGRSALSQRVRRKCFQKYTTPIPFPVASMPFTFSKISSSSPSPTSGFGVTNQSRTERLAQFELYRNELLENNTTPLVDITNNTPNAPKPDKRPAARRCIIPKQLFGGETDEQYERDDESINVMDVDDQGLNRMTTRSSMPNVLMCCENGTEHEETRKMRSCSP